MASKNKYKKVKVNPWAIIGSLGFVVVIIAVILILTPSAHTKFYNAYKDTGNLKFESEFKDHVFEAISLKELEKKLNNNEPFVFYFGTPTCSVCSSEIGYYNKYYKDSGLADKIYYVDSITASSALLEFLANKGIDTSATPQLVVFNKGKIKVDLNSYSGNTIKRLQDFYKEALLYLS